MARQHPGEPQGSWMMQGLLEFLLSNSEIATFLKEKCVFKIVPMINIDGVVHGNYRTSLAGCDLNRRWKKPKRKLHPIVFAIKEMIKKFKTEREIKLIMDLHGHSRKQNAFFYGCSYKEEPVATRIYPFLFSKLNPHISFNFCSFNVNKDKEKTARVALWKELRITNVFTLEASFYGYHQKNQVKDQKKKNLDMKEQQREAINKDQNSQLESLHFNIEDMLNMGKDICINLYNIMKDECKDPKNDNTGKFCFKQTEENVQMMKDLNNQIIINQDEDEDDSDSDPSGDELSEEELIKILPKNALSKKQKNIISSQKDTEKPVQNDKKKMSVQQQLVQQQNEIQKKKKLEEAAQLEKQKQQQKQINLYKNRIYSKLVQKKEKDVKEEEKIEVVEMRDQETQTEQSFIMELKNFYKRNGIKLGGTKADKQPLSRGFSNVKQSQQEKKEERKDDKFYNYQKEQTSLNGSNMKDLATSQKNIKERIQKSRNQSEVVVIKNNNKLPNIKNFNSPKKL